MRYPRGRWGMGGMPRQIRPMLASLRHRLPADDDRYGWEFKWDGVRAIAYAGGGSIRLLSRTGKDMTSTYPELAVLAGRAGVPVILDGEIVAIRSGRPGFRGPHPRIHRRAPPGGAVPGRPRRSSPVHPARQSRAHPRCQP